MRLPGQTTNSARPSSASCLPTRHLQHASSQAYKPRSLSSILPRSSRCKYRPRRTSTYRISRDRYSPESCFTTSRIQASKTRLALSSTLLLKETRVQTHTISPPSLFPSFQLPQHHNCCSKSLGHGQLCLVDRPLPHCMPNHFAIHKTYIHLLMLAKPKQVDVRAPSRFGSLTFPKPESPFLW